MVILGNYVHRLLGDTNCNRLRVTFSKFWGGLIVFTFRIVLDFSKIAGFNSVHILHVALVVI